MTDDQLDAILAREARSYHLPPEPPREAMWDAIQRARDESTVVALPTRRRVPSWFRSAAGIAAVLLLGVAIGRWSHTHGNPAPSAATASPSYAAQRDQSATRDTAEPALGTETAPGDDRSPSAGVGRARRYAVGDPAIDRARAAEARAMAASIDERRARRADDRRRDASSAGDMTSYRMAVLEHMTRTELLLTSFRAQSPNATHEQVDAQFAGLARDLLRTTRLLLSTRDTEDPQLTHLLEDLELVLMQITQYVADGRRGDLEAINQSLDRRSVLPKLRSTIPAGASGT